MLPDEFPERTRRAIFCAIIVLGAVLRLWGLSSNPVALNQDEAVGGYDALAIATTLRDHHGNFLPVLFESFEDWVSPALTYLTVPFVKVFGLSEFSIRLVTALAGTATLALMYLLLRRLKLSEVAALSGTLMLAVAPWHITLSRWAIPPSIVPVFLLLTAWLALRAAAPNEQRWGRWVAFIVSAVALTYSYPTQKLFAPLWVAATVAFLILPHWKKGFLLLLGYATLVLPMYWLALSDPRRYNARFNDVALDFRQAGIVWQVAQRYGEYWLSDFQFGRGDTDVMHHVPGVGAMYPVAAFLFFFGVGLTVARAAGWNPFALGVDRRVAFVLLAWLVLFPLPASLTRDHMHLLRAVHGLPATVIFSALGLAGILSGMTSAPQRWATVALLACVSLVDAGRFTSEYWGPYRNDTRGHFQYGLRQVIERALLVERGYQEVKVSRDINSAYIFYLFVSRKDPATLNYAQVNEHVDGSGNWLTVSKIDKWDFTGVSDDDVRNAKEIYRVEADGRVWRSLWAKGSTLFIR